MIGFKDSAATDGVDNSGLIVASESSVARGREQLQAAGVRIVRHLDGIPAVVAIVQPPAVAALRTSPFIDYIEPVKSGKFDAAAEPVSLLSLIKVPRRTQTISWSVDRVEAPIAWPISDGHNVYILLLDSGVGSHRDLYVATHWRCIAGEVYDRKGHGTFVAGIIAAQDNADDVIGVAHGAWLMSANVADFLLDPDAAEVACSIGVGRVNGVFAYNLSLSLPPSTAVTDQIRAATREGAVVVGSAGNAFGGPVTFPGYLPEVLTVTATTQLNTRSTVAAVGPEIDISAPGVDVLSTTLPGGTTCQGDPGAYVATCSAVSVAVPHVTGAAAIIKAKYPNMTGQEIRGRLTGTALSLGPQSEFGAGLLRLSHALGAPPSATISGPNSVRPSEPCTWTANVTGDYAPFTFQWYKDGSEVGSNSSEITIAFAYAGTLGVSVTDRTGGKASNSISVGVSASAPVCFQ